MTPLLFLRRRIVALLLTFFLAAGHLVQAQVPVWRSLIGISSSNSSASVTYDVTDAAGNIYVCGYFSGSINLGNTTLTSAGAYDLFVAKWQPQSNRFAWVQQYGSTGSEWPNAMTVSGTSVYLTGSYYGSPFRFGATTLPDNGPLVNTAFVARLTDAGATATPDWALKMNTNATIAEAGEIVVVGTSVYVAGTFSKTAQFGNLVRTSAGAGDAYVAKLTDVGTSASFTWIQQAGGPLDDHAFQLVGVGKNLYVSGTFQGGSTFGNIILNEKGGTDSFIAKLTDAGPSASFAWAERVGSNVIENNSTSIGALAVAGPNVYLAGEFSQTITLGTLQLTAPFANNSNMYVAKLTDAESNAKFEWAQQAGGAGGSAISTALTVAGNSLYVAGNFSSRNAQFGAITLTNSGPGSLDSDIFVAKLTDGGTTAAFNWAIQAGSSAEGYEEVNSLAPQGGTVVVGGAAIPSAAFGNLVLTGAAGNKVGFLATLTDPTVTATAPSMDAENLVVFPNPTRDRVTVRLPAVAGVTTAVLTLSDALGRTMRRQPVALNAAGATAEIQLVGLAPGLYHLRVQAGGQQASRALTVE